MTTVKADAHFVDCDLATGPGGDWDSNQGQAVTDVYDSAIMVTASLYIINSTGKFINAGSSARNVQDNGDGTHRVGISIDAHGYEVGDSLQVGGRLVYIQAFDGGDSRNSITVGDTISGSIDSKVGTVKTISYTDATDGFIEYTLDYVVADNGVDNPYDNNEIITTSVSGNQVTMNGASTVRRYQSTTSTSWDITEVSSSEVFFNAADPFQARTFDGTEPITRIILEGTYTGACTGTPVETNDNAYLVIPASSTVGATSTPLHYMDKSDWTTNLAYFAAPSRPASVASGTSIAAGVGIDPTDSDSLYATINWAGDRDFLHKYKISDGSLVWQCGDEIVNSGSYDIGSTGIVLTNSRFGDGLFSVGLNTVNPTNGAFLASYPRTFTGAYSGSVVPSSVFSYVDEETQYQVNVCFGEGDTSGGDLPLSVACDFEGGTQYQWVPAPEVAMDGKGWTTAWYNNGYVYFAVNTYDLRWQLTSGDANVFRFKFNVDASGNVTLGSFDSYYLNPIPKRIQAGVNDTYNWGRLSGVATGAQENSRYELIKYDAAMNPVVNYETNWTPLSNLYFQIFDEVDTTTYFVNQQDRTVAYPEDRAHLEGQWVQVLADGTQIGI